MKKTEKKKIINRNGEGNKKQISKRRNSEGKEETEVEKKK